MAIEGLVFPMEDELMTPAEMKAEILEALAEMKGTVNSWATRDTLKDFTSFDFWTESGGETMAIIDMEMAEKIRQALTVYVSAMEPNLGHRINPFLDEVYTTLLF